MSKYAIQVKDVRKRFSYSSHKNNSLKRAITQLFKPKDTSVDTFYALDGVSFNVEKGDFFGILGRNGSGKSTLLKIISEIYQPTSGSVKHEGKLVSFIELGVGFKSELTGKENVYLNAALLGFSRSEIDEMYDDIVSFAELEKFMDQQLKNYSSGMKVRLAFSVAIRSKSDILILDEVLAVGDAAFRKKSNDYFMSLKDTGQTVILVTHSMANVKRFCNKAIVIEDGRIIYSGNSEGAADKYNNLFNKAKLPVVNSYENDAIKSGSVDIDYSKGRISLTVKAEPTQDIEDVVVAVLIYRGSKSVFRWVSDEEIDSQINLSKSKLASMNISVQNIFPPGTFNVSVMIRSRDRSTDYAIFDNIASFENVINKKYPHKRLWSPEVNFKNDK